MFGVVDFQEDLGWVHKWEGRKQLEEKGSFQRFHSASSPSLEGDVMQSRAITPFHDSATLLEEGEKNKCLQVFSQEAWECISCQGVVHMAAPKPGQHAWPHHTCGKLGNCRDCLFHCPGKWSP